MATVLKRTLYEVTKDLFTKKRKGKPQRLVDPFKLVCEQHWGHPKIEELQKYHKENDAEAEARLTATILREAWQKYLAKTKPTDITGIYKYIRKKDGRDSQSFRYPCSAPITYKGLTHTTPKNKCEALADYFHHKLTDPTREQRQNNVLEHEQQEPSQNDRHKAQLHPVRKRPADIPATKWKKRRNAITEPFQSFREIEIRKAAEELPKG